MKKRASAHLRDAIKGKKNKKFQDVFNSHRVLSLIPILYCDSEMCTILEQKFLDMYCQKDPKCCNQNPHSTGGGLGGVDNPMYGKRGKDSPNFGKNNGRYDPTLYIWSHPEEGDVVATCYELANTYNLDRSQITKLRKGKRKSSGGWTFGGVKIYD